MEYDVRHRQSDQLTCVSAPSALESISSAKGDVEI